ncbi:MAG: type I restriction enzyme HsdR N-terminal domain-containing protein [Bacteroidales bacterium]|nr:type I restriction enzyme HsdR N-terminal domain-containing protein [Bacteroidales bacterium]
MESDYIWDPLRRKSVRNTPEEQVRQWFISVLHEGMGVPEHMMGSEVALKHGAKEYRADIVVYDHSAAPIMVVECKRPEVELDQQVVDQALRYNNELNVKYIAISNGLKTFIFERTVDGWEFMQKAPLWEEMAGQGRP